MTAALFLVALAASAPGSLQSVLDDQRISQDVPGVSAVVIRRGATVFAGASGVADLETSALLTADSVFYIGSLSKVLTAVLTLNLVESERMSLHDVVAGIGEDAAQITVAHLLTHSSGLEREGNFGYWFTADFPDSEALAAYLLNTNFRSPPGTSLHYSNVGYAALGPVVEQASKQRYSDALTARVLEPLGMKASGASGPAAQVVNGYTPSGRVIPSAKRPFAGIGKQIGDRRVRMYHDARAMSPAFGAYSSANDMGRLLRFLLGHGGDAVISKKMRTRMQERQASGWGLGLKIRKLSGRKVARHDGWFAAHRTHLLLDIENGIGVVVMANSDNATPGKIADALLKATLAETSR